jgi:hypothetical protein
MTKVLYLAAALLGAAVSAPTVLAQTHDVRPDEIEDLPEGKGREETFYGCTACHGLAIVVRQGLTRQGWEDMLQLMYTRHNMAELPRDDETAILAYLTEKFPPRRRGTINPFLR